MTVVFKRRDQPESTLTLLREGEIVGRRDRRENFRET
jgi:hypothetical protein